MASPKNEESAAAAKREHSPGAFEVCFQSHPTVSIGPDDDRMHHQRSVRALLTRTKASQTPHIRGQKMPKTTDQPTMKLSSTRSYTRRKFKTKTKNLRLISKQGLFLEPKNLKNLTRLKKLEELRIPQKLTANKSLRRATLITTNQITKRARKSEKKWIVDLSELIKLGCVRRATSLWTTPIYGIIC